MAVRDKRASAAPAREAAAVVAYSQMAAMLDRMEEYAIELDWLVHRAPKGTGVPRLMCCGHGRLVFVDVLPEDTTPDEDAWARYLLWHRELDALGGPIQVEVYRPSEFPLFVAMMEE